MNTATHLVLGDASAEKLRRAGVKSIVVLRDLLSVGRSHAQPASHRAARMAQWGIDERAAQEGVLDRDRFAAVLARIHDPIVLWTSPTWPSRLYEWATIDWLATLDARSVTRAEIDRHFPAEAITAAFEARTQLGEARLECARGLWAAFVQTSPLAFDALRRSHSAVYLDLRITCEGFGATFPRRVDGRLTLSYLDELLLVGIGDTWSTRDAIFLGSRRQEVLDGPLGWFGDTNLFARLAQLHRHGVIERDGESYRLSSRGRRLRDEGTTNVADFAPLDLGGFRINDPASPYVREAYEDGWRIVAG